MCLGAASILVPSTALHVIHKCVSFMFSTGQSIVKSGQVKAEASATTNRRRSVIMHILHEFFSLSVPKVICLVREIAVGKHNVP